MSGPIVRKYGFPNFDKIFGPKPLLHGKEEESSPAEESRKQVEEAGAKSGERSEGVVEASKKPS